MRRLWLFVLLIAVSGCGRYFAGPLRPAAEQDPRMSVNDDGSVTFTQGRLEVSLQPMTDAQLNRQFASDSFRGARSTNPYTFGDWQPLGAGQTPQRFTVFRMTVRNYEYPKVMLDPSLTSISTGNQRQYSALTYYELDEYFRAYWLGRTGQGREEFEARTDLLRRTMYPADPVFSGQEMEGYVVFPALHDDVTQIKVTVPSIAVRFNFAGQPVEALDVTYAFDREVFRGYQPPVELAGQQ